MFHSLKGFIYYLWNGERKEEYDNRNNELDSKNRERIAQSKTEREIEERRLAAEERAKEQAYQEFLKRK